MKRLVLLLGTLALAAAFHSHARAQTSTQAIQIPLEVKRNGKQIENAQEVYGTLEDCESNATFDFAMDFSATVPVWEAWLGVGSTDCSAVNNRTVTGSTVAKPVCKFLKSDTRNTARPRITEVRAVDMFSRDWGATKCDGVSRQLYTIYLLPLPQETSLGSNTASAVLQIGTYGTRTATFTLYTNIPEAPTNVKGIDGEVRIGVSFDTIAGAQPKTRYRAYFDWGTGGPGECGSGVLDGVSDAGAEEEMDAGEEEDMDAGTDAETDPDAEAAMDAGADAGADAASGSSDSGVRPPPSGTPNVQSVTVTTGKAYLTDLDSRGIEIGDSVAVSVVTVDPSDNESNLTEPICVPRKLTESFVDNCKQDPECRDGFNTCSLSPGQRNGGLLGLGSLIGLAAALVLRRRRHV